MLPFKMRKRWISSVQRTELTSVRSTQVRITIKRMIPGVSASPPSPKWAGNREERMILQHGTAQAGPAVTLHCCTALLPAAALAPPRSPEGHCCRFYCSWHTASPHKNAKPETTLPDQRPEQQKQKSFLKTKGIQVQEVFVWSVKAHKSLFVWRKCTAEFPTTTQLPIYRHTFKNH